jgi:hypothetical protein
MLPERDSGPHSPLFRFKLHKAIFTISTDLVLEKLGFFQADPSRVRSGEYEVLTPVPVEIFRDFVKIVEGSSPPIAHHNWAFFTQLSDEFSFASLSDACKAFADSRLFRPGFELSSIVAPILLRVTALEDRHRSLERFF